MQDIHDLPRIIKEAYFIAGTGRPGPVLIDKIEQISIAHLLAEAIVRIHEKRPLSPLFEVAKKA